MQISDEAVEAAAKAIYESESYQNRWDWPVSELDREEYRKHARAALEAAAPYLMAEAFEQGQKSGMRHADRLVAAARIGRPELPGPISPNPYRGQP